MYNNVDIISDLVFGAISYYYKIWNEIFISINQHSYYSRYYRPQWSLTLRVFPDNFGNKRVLCPAL